MTRQEAKKYLEIELRLWESECKSYNPVKEALKMAIKALEQESVLDKIRGEIEQLTIAEGGDDYVRKMAELLSLKIKVLQIIDKYNRK
jgi:hypothetical protein